MSEHTPGPWFLGDLDQNSQRIVRQEHIEIATCWHHCVGSIEKEMEANARLIAAAPELLTVAQLAHEFVQSCIRAGQSKAEAAGAIPPPFALETRLANAIAKAEGQA